MSFAAASTFAQVGPSEHRGTLDAAWAQGRGAYGGLVAAILARAVERDAPAGQSLASLTVSFCAPAAPGEAVVRTEVVRAGRNASVLRAVLAREGAVVATALATCMRLRTEALGYDDLAMPAVPGPDEVAEGPPELAIPAFAKFFEFRQCLGTRPFSGAHEARVGGWCQLREDAVIDRALACALLDAWPPAAASLAPAWCPVASLEIRYDFLDVRGDTGWTLYDARSRFVSGGLADERATLWTHEGRAIAIATQRIAIFPSPA